jgi:hypothetical protein
MTNRETVSSYLLHSSFASVWLSQASANCTKILGQSHFAGPNLHGLTFLHPILMCRVAYWAPHMAIFTLLIVLNPCVYLHSHYQDLSYA